MRKLTLFIVGIGLLAPGASSALAAAAPPQNTTAPSISGTARQGETLTADPGVWSGTQPLRYTYQWRRCDNTGASCANVVGATDNTYKLGSADIGNTLRVRVTATSSAGSTSVVSAATGVVAAPPPQSLTLTADRDLVVYGGSVLLTGTLSGAHGGETVTITEKAQGTAVPDKTVTATTDASGSFSIAVQPLVHTSFVAAAGSVKSDPADVVVRPRVQLRHSGFHRYRVRVSAARPLLHKVALVQRWNRHLHVWVAIRRVRLSAIVDDLSPTVVTGTSFRLLHLSGVRVRVVVPLSQARPGYVSGSSGSLSA